MIGQLLWGTAILATVALLLALLISFALRWVAIGEPDANGDPEKDASGIDQLKPTKFYGKEWDEIERTHLNKSTKTINHYE